MKNSNNTSLFEREQVRESLKQSLIKLHPGMMMRNPIMFTVEIATMIMLLVTGLFPLERRTRGFPL